ncbi:MAG: translation initiation factor IF-2 [Candidatus Marinimicrobia bacterium]|nr:translation initiation factor IF-2 [Candidatus Neomarinimicrobiota bacterium]
MKKRRIFHIAKELNISHIEIIKFLKKDDASDISINTSVDEDVYFKILRNFSKEKDIVERINKEKARKEAEKKRKEEETARLEAEKLHKEILADATSLSDDFVSQASDYIMTTVADLYNDLVTDKKKNEPAEIAREVSETVVVSEKEILNEPVKTEKNKPFFAQHHKKDAKTTTPVMQPKPVMEKPKKTQENETDENKFGKKPKKVKSDLAEKLDSIRHAGSKGKKLKRVTITDIEDDVNRQARGKKKKNKRGKQVDAEKVDQNIKQTMAKMSQKTVKKKYKKRRHDEDIDEDSRLIKISEFSTVEDLAKHLNVEPAEVIKHCISLGMFVTINQRLDFDTIQLIASEFEYEVEQLKQYGEEVLKIDESEEDIEKAIRRSPIVAVMGHVDHGKTTLLDYIRKTNVVSGESGGITQHIGAYQVELENGDKITFLDTPGHEAFTAMRARGAQVTDIVVLIVAADDGVMPRTVEAINHAKSAEVPIIVAINKIDKPEANIEKVKRELSEHGILVESWGGEIQSSEISAKSGKGVEHLMELILLEAEILDLKANANTLAKGTVIEARIDNRHGPIATVLLQKGTLKVGQPFVCGGAFGKVRVMFNENGMKLDEVTPGQPVRIVGFDIVPKLADIFAGVESEKEARKIAAERQKILREQQHRQVKQVFSLDAISARIAEGNAKTLNVILKADMDGSVEALSEVLGKLGNKEVSVSIKHKAAGHISENDVLLAKASDSIVIGFNVPANPKVKELAKQENVEIRRYRIIYELQDDIKSALEGLLTPDKVEEKTGTAEVRMVIRVPNVGNIAGSYVTHGELFRGSMGRLIRDGQVIHTGEIGTIKRFKDDVKSIKEGYECGINLEGFDNYLEGDIIEGFEIKSVKRKLE